jgi:uncharacterized MAPEG superfamily protein
MTATSIVFLHYIVLILLSLLALAGYRTYLGMSGYNKKLKFAADGSDVPAFGFRLTRVHANAVECFPFIGGLLLYAMATGSTDITDGLAYVLFGARLAQSLILLISTSPLAIQLRFATFLVQFAICAYWTWLFMQPLM